MSTRFCKILNEMNDIYNQRNAEYKNAYKDSGAIYTALFPEGITLQNEKDFLRFSLFMLALMKVTRIASSWDDPKRDNYIDGANYLVMLAEIEDSK